MKPLKLVLTDHWFEEIKSGLRKEQIDGLVFDIELGERIR